MSPSPLSNVRKLPKPEPEIDTALVAALEDLLLAVKLGSVKEVVVAYATDEESGLDLILNSDDVRFNLYAAEGIRASISFD